MGYRVVIGSNPIGPISAEQSASIAKRVRATTFHSPGFEVDGMFPLVGFESGNGRRTTAIRTAFGRSSLAFR